MAGKEATIYILDLGASLSKKRHGRQQSDLEWALEYVWDKITTTVSGPTFGELVHASRHLCLSLALFLSVRGQSYRVYYFSMGSSYKLTRYKVATGRKTAIMSVIGCRTDSTDLLGVMDDAEGYENIMVFSGVKQYLLADIRNLQVHLKTSKTNDGDCKPGNMYSCARADLSSTFCSCGGYSDD